MTWELLVMLAIKEGLPIALKIFERWTGSSGKPVTIEEIQGLRGEAQKLAVDRARAKLIELGIDPESDKGRELLQLTQQAF